MLVERDWVGCAFGPHKLPLRGGFMMNSVALERPLLGSLRDDLRCLQVQLDEQGNELVEGWLSQIDRLLGKSKEQACS